MKLDDELVALAIVKGGCSLQEIGRDEPMVGVEPLRASPAAWL
jgi:hypothetical protein